MNGSLTSKKIRCGVSSGEFHMADVDVAARPLLTTIDGLWAQTVMRASEPKHIARSSRTSEMTIASSGGAKH
ncbi:hypothetical protein [Mycolicibacterium sp. 120270]|uniref:hypothetical protein n=1 Tax=Mycolicibacterium sp. 120270 TaxID=3090600 RepID=UPI00299D9408|nr:hypothetical protein [Mycolicibacterium sp. 120270]MDX1886061.1 hypothetical protein [Mycolicibacterium sp. 120270]